MTPTHAAQPHHNHPPPTGGAAQVDLTDHLRRLTARDRWLIDLLAEHDVLTTEQITTLAFTHPHTARNRLADLHRRDVLTRSRDCIRPGSQSWRWALGPVGATIAAIGNDQPIPRPATVRARANRHLASPRLGHLLGVNGFFVNLASWARHHPGCALHTWWSERTCRQVTGELARPDGYGVWTERGRTVSWWLEWDTGSEATHRVTAKLDGYRRLHAATGTRHAVLIHLASARAETSLHHRLRDRPALADELTVATTSPDAGHPAEAAWWPVGRVGRLRLVDLADQSEHHARAA